MEVYIEYAIIDNLIMDYVLLKSAARLTKSKESFFRLSMGALVGCVVAVILPVFNLNDGVLFFIKILLGMLICLIGCNFKSVFHYFRFFNVFLLLTFAVGGAIIGILTLMGIDYSTEGVRSAGVLPVGVNILCAYACCYFVKKAIDRTQKRIERGYCCDVIIDVGEKRVKINGFIDSGNMLIDAKSALPVVVCTKKVVERLFGVNARPQRFMPITTASGFGLLSIYEIDSVTTVTKNGRTVSDAVLGVNEKSGVLVDDADAIVGIVLV